MSILTIKEMKDQFRIRQKKPLIAWLKANGYKYRVGRDGWPVLSRTHVEEMQAPPPAPALKKRDFNPRHFNPRPSDKRNDTQRGWDRFEDCTCIEWRLWVGDAETTVRVHKMHMRLRPEAGRLLAAQRLRERRKLLKEFVEAHKNNNRPNENTEHPGSG